MDEAMLAFLYEASYGTEKTQEENALQIEQY